MDIETYRRLELSWPGYKKGAIQASTQQYLTKVDITVLAFHVPISIIKELLGWLRSQKPSTSQIASRSKEFKDLEWAFDPFLIFIISRCRP